MSRATDVVTITGEEYDTMLSDAERWRWIKPKLAIKTEFGVWWLEEDGYQLGGGNCPEPSSVDDAVDMQIQSSNAIELTGRGSEAPEGPR